MPLTSRHATTDFADAQRAAVASTGAPRRNAESTIPRPWPFGARARASRHEKITLAPVTNSCQTLNARRRHARRAGVKGLRQASKQASNVVVFSREAGAPHDQPRRTTGRCPCLRSKRAPASNSPALSALHTIGQRFVLLQNALHLAFLRTTMNHAAFSRCTDLAP